MTRLHRGTDFKAARVLLVLFVALGFGCQKVTKQTASNAAHRSLADAAEPTSNAATPATSSRSSISGTTHYVPESASAENRRPLLMFLHGLGGTGRGFFDTLKLGEFGKRHQIFVVAPNGSVDSVGRRFWNAHRACCNFDSQKVDHVAALSGLLESLLDNHPIDKDRVYLMGFSNGGFMAHRLGCEWGDRLSGIVSLAGAGPDADVACANARKLRVLEIHGDADSTVKYHGGTLFDIPDITYSSARDTVDNWARRLRCKGGPKDLGHLDLSSRLPDAETNQLVYDDCGASAVGLWTTHGGSHLFTDWPVVVEQAWAFLNRP